MPFLLFFFHFNIFGYVSVLCCANAINFIATALHARAPKSRFFKIFVVRCPRVLSVFSPYCSTGHFFLLLLCYRIPTYLRDVIVIALFLFCFKKLCSHLLLHAHTTVLRVCSGMMNRCLFFFCGGEWNSSFFTNNRIQKLNYLLSHNNYVFYIKRIKSDR